MIELLIHAVGVVFFLGLFYAWCIWLVVFWVEPPPPEVRENVESPSDRPTIF